MEHETHFHFLEVREQSYSLFLGGNLLLEHSFTHSKVPWTWSWDFRGGILHPPLTTCWWLEEQEKTELHSSSQDRAGLSGFVPQPPRKVDTSIIYLTNRDFRGWVTSPSSQRSGERGWGLQRADFARFQSLCAFPSATLSGTRYFPNLPFLIREAGIDGIFFVLLLCCRACQIQCHKQWCLMCHLTHGWKAIRANRDEIRISFPRCFKIFCLQHSFLDQMGT